MKKQPKNKKIKKRGELPSGILNPLEVVSGSLEEENPSLQTPARLVNSEDLMNNSLGGVSSFCYRTYTAAWISSV